MTNTPKVSILVPIYNNEIYLHECIDSIINQTLKDIEIILLDDGSTDSSPQICDEYAKKDSRIKVIHKENTGYGHTMNLGIQLAKGEYIGIVESDDYVELDMFETLYNATAQDNQKMDIVKSNRNIFYENGQNRKFIPLKHIYKDENYNKVLIPSKNPDMVAYDNIVIWSSIYKRSFLLENNIKFNETSGASYQDQGFFIQTYLLAKSFYAIDKSFYNLRRDNPNSSVASKEKVYVICKEYDFIENFLNKHNFNQNIHNAVLYKKFFNYSWTLSRIDTKYRMEFTNKFKEDFKHLTNEDLKYFDNEEKMELKIITQNPNITIKENHFLNKNGFVCAGLLFFVILLVFVLVKIKKV